MVLNAIDRRIAISGLMPARPFRMLERVLWLTPKGLGGIGDVEVEGLQAKFHEDSARVGGIVHGHGVASVVVFHVLWFTDTGLSRYDTKGSRTFLSAAAITQRSEEDLVSSGFVHSIQRGLSERGLRVEIREKDARMYL